VLLFPADIITGGVTLMALLNFAQVVRELEGR
jgi:hypothetical protein